MLDYYRIESLHMADFVRPYGQHVGMYPEFKIALFTEAVKILNARKAYSFSVAVNNTEFKNAVSPEFYRGVVGPYTIAFITLAMMNSKLANQNDYPDKIAYLVDQGSPFAEQLRMGHLMVAAFENSQNATVRTGGLMFADDAEVSALQAADLIAWTARRQFSGDGIHGEFTPLLDIFKKRFDDGGRPVRPHVHYQVQDDFAKSVMDDLAVNGNALHQKAMASVQALIGDSA
jgi:hypothetical protein